MHDILYTAPNVTTVVNIQQIQNYHRLTRGMDTLGTWAPKERSRHKRRRICGVLGSL